MRQPFLHYVLFFCILTFFSTLGCGAQSFNYQKEGDEMMEGGGVFSGDDGEFTLYQSKDAPADKAAEEPAAPPSAETAEGAAATTTTDNQIPPEYKEFLEFQAWKKEKADFENFQEWKQSKDGADEYQEFLEWKRWRDYQKWQQQNANDEK
jgi:hypothetical protein